MDTPPNPNPDPLLADFATNGSADPGVLAEVESHFHLALPTEYQTFLLGSDGGEGFIGTQYLVLWRASELIEFNREYEVAQHAPGLMLIGTDGGGEGFAFDTRASILSIVIVPLIGMSLEDAITVVPDFSQFFSRLSIAEGLFLETDRPL